MEPWIIATLIAAFMQNLRFMLQKHLKATHLSTAGATFARFIYSSPLVIILVIVYAQLTAQDFPAFSTRFWAFAMIGALAQIVATMCVVALFATRNFAVGITFKKTEVMLTALVGLVVLGEGLSGAGFAAILVGFVGVVMLSDPPGGAPGRRWVRRIWNRAAGLGLLSGVFFGISGVCYRGASLALASEDYFLRASLTLACVTAAQTVGMALWLRWREIGEIGRVIANWRIAGLVGLTSMAGSLGWFTAYTLQTAAYVGALGQIELLFSFLGSWFIFGERGLAREYAGIALVFVSILILILVI